MTRPTTPRRRRQHATAVRQALSLYEAEALASTGDSPGPPRDRPANRRHPRISAGRARAALRATGVPPDLAAVLRNRLRLPELEDPA
jgi:hypothetical protein